MGQGGRKLAKAQVEIEDLRSALNAADAKIREVTADAWEMQLVLCAVLEKVCENGALVLTLEERKRALDEGWGVERSILPDDSKPMVVRVVKQTPGEGS